MQNVVALVQRC